MDRKYLGNRLAELARKKADSLWRCTEDEIGELDFKSLVNFRRKVRSFENYMSTPLGYYHVFEWKGDPMKKFRCPTYFERDKLINESEKSIIKNECSIVNGINWERLPIKIV